MAERRRQVRPRHPHRRPRGDDALRRHAHLAARARLLARVHARRPPLHALLRRAHPVHRGDAARWSSPTTRCSCSSAGSSWACARSCSSGTGGRRRPTADAALKAFLTTRTGDVGLMIGIIDPVLRGRARSRIEEIARKALGRQIGHTVLVAASVAPAHRDHRQERPVPAAHVAARRHGRPDAGVGAHPRRHDGRRRRVPRSPASTPSSPRASIDVDGRHFNLMALIGGITIVIAAVLAFVQDDIKKVLAYSTISQLGYMVMGLGVGAWIGGGLPPLHARVLQVPASSSAPARSATPARTTAST